MLIDDELRLEAELLRVGRDLANEVVRFRAIPLRVQGKRGADVWFVLSQRLQGVQGALEAFERNMAVIRPAVAEVVRTLRSRPHDDYDADFSEAAIDDYVMVVAENWDRVRVRGADALAAAFTEAQAAPIALLPPLTVYGKKFVLLASTAYYLQVYRRGQPILLPQTRFASLFGYTDHAYVSKMLALARKHGLITRVGDWSRRERRAAPYRFNLESQLYEPPTRGAR